MSALESALSEVLAPVSAESSVPASSPLGAPGPPPNIAPTSSGVKRNAGAGGCPGAIVVPKPGRVSSTVWPLAVTSSRPSSENASLSAPGPRSRTIARLPSQEAAPKVPRMPTVPTGILTVTSSGPPFATLPVTNLRAPLVRVVATWPDSVWGS